MVMLFASWRLSARRSDTLNALRRLADIGIKLNFQAMIKAAASAADPIAWGGCASSRLDHSLKV